MGGEGLNTFSTNTRRVMFVYTYYWYLARKLVRPHLQLTIAINLLFHANICNVLHFIVDQRDSQNPVNVVYKCPIAIISGNEPFLYHIRKIRMSITEFNPRPITSVGFPALLLVRTEEFLPLFLLPLCRFCQVDRI